MAQIIKKVEPLLLSAPYADESNMEVRLHLPTGYRTCGMVKMELEDGTYGLGEAYLAVFAPAVFKTAVELVAPYIEGRDIADRVGIVHDLEVVTGYWSRQGAARHVISAIDIALYDLLSKLEGKPLYKYLNPQAPDTLRLYASGGDSHDCHAMEKELEEVSAAGIDEFKIRARKDNLDKALWTVRHASARGIRIAVDMTQNLVIPGQTEDEVVRFIEGLDSNLSFVEEPMGPARIDRFPSLRKRVGCKVAGGEIITTPEEIIACMDKGCYDIAQPDASVIGGISALKTIFDSRKETDVYVHCWGGAVGMMANYHAAAAFGGKTAEWPLPHFPLREKMMDANTIVRDGILHLPDTPGLGVVLTDGIVSEYPFRPDSVYHCLTVIPNKAVPWPLE